MSDQLKNTGIDIGMIFGNFKKITPILLAVLLADAVLLFSPIDFLNKLGIGSLPFVWRRRCGVIFLVGMPLVIILFLKEYIAPQIRNWRVRRILRKRYISLSPHYKAILLQMLESPSQTMRLNETAASTQYLKSNNFIRSIQGYIFFGPGYIEPNDYMPEAWLLDLYSKEPNLFSKR